MMKSNGGASKPLASTSASLNPYEVEPPDAVDDAKVRAWLATVDSEMGQHRSPFVAAEVILCHLDEYAAQIKHPDQIYLATTLAVLRRCVPQLAPEFRDIATAAIHEIIPAISFTHTDTSTDFSAPSAGAAHADTTMTKSSYSECFLRVFRLYRSHAARLQKLSQRDESKEHLMDRVMERLDDLWVKMCFLTWRIHCKKLRDKKVFFQRLVKRGIESRFVHLYVRNWRVYAHKTIQAARISHASTASKELDRLHPIEQEAKNAHERATEAMREKMRLLEESNQRCHETRIRLDELKSLLAVTQQSLREHWWTWQACVRAIFTDPRALPKISEDDDSAVFAFAQNITDTAAKYRQRARARTNKLGLKHIQQFLEFTGHLQMPSAGGSAMTSVTAMPFRPEHDMLGVDSPSSAALTLASRPSQSQRLSTARRTQAPSVALVLTALTNACRPVVAPFHAFDYLHADQSRLTLTLNFLSYVLSGGHCSLFTHPAALTVSAAPTTHNGAAREADAAPTATQDNHAIDGVGGDDTLLEPVPALASGTRMVEDVSEGLDQLHDSTQYNDRYLLSVRHVLSTSEMDLVQDCVARLFQRWSLVGLPLDRQRVEAVTHSLVATVDRPVVSALYPSRGIHTLTELLNYLTSVAEFSGQPLLTVADRLEFNYVFEPEEALILQLHSPGVNTFCREHSATLTRLWNHLRLDSAMEVSFEKAKTFLVDTLLLDAEEVDEIWACARSPGQHNKVSKDDFEKLLLVAGEYVNPSPFVSPAEKLAQVVDGWLAEELRGTA